FPEEVEEASGTEETTVEGYTSVEGYTEPTTTIGFSASLPVPEIARFAVSVKLLNATFTDDLKAQQSDQYEDMKTVMVVALREILDKKLDIYDIVDITFSKGSGGSVVVNYTLNIPKDHVDVLDDVATAIKGNNGAYAGFKIDPTSVETPAFPWLAVVLGTILSVVLLVLVVILVIFAVRRFRKRRHRESSESYATTSYSPTFSRRPMLWQLRSPAMLTDLTSGQQYEQQRMNVDWNALRNFIRPKGREEWVS
ncbi:hypothetical protein LSAT2_020038, partial [Lamellibrachia satsuma]